MSSSLRSRGKKDPPPPRDDSPAKAEEVRLAPVSKIIYDDSEHPHNHKQQKNKNKRRNGFIFALGGLFGILVAGFFAGRNDLIDIPAFGDLSMDSMMDILPAGFVKDARDLAVKEREKRSTMILFQ
ncbi:hypothetical protein WAI453_007322 [Rhynchosporium graminicola]